MTTLLDRADLSRHAVPAPPFGADDDNPHPALRPVAAWQVAADGKLICVWTLRPTISVRAEMETA